MEQITPRYLTLRQCAQYASIPLRTFQKTWTSLTKYGLNPTRLPNGRLRFDRTEIDRVMQTLKVIKE